MASGGQQTQYAQPANYNISPGTRADGQSSALEVTNKGTLKVSIFDNNNNPVTPAPLNLSPYDYVSRVLNGDNITEVWTFRNGGSGGTVTNTLTVVYTDITLSTILNVTKT